MIRKKHSSHSGQAAIRFSDSIEALADAAKTCRACEIWSRATQTVFGEGNASAEVMLVGEQPGNQEDLAGHPFVGPAGKLLDAVFILLRQNYRQAQYVSKRTIRYNIYENKALALRATASEDLAPKLFIERAAR